MNKLFEVKSAPKLIETIYNVERQPIIEFFEIQSGWSSIEGNFSAIETEVERRYVARKVGETSDREVMLYWAKIQADIAQHTSRFDRWLTIEQVK